MALSDDLHTIPRLVGDTFEQLGKLLQNEVQLARAEVSEKLAQAAMGAAYLGAAAVLFIPVLVVLLIALALWLTSAFGLSPVTAHLAAGGVGAVIGIALALVGLNHLKAEKLKPKVTIRQVERDIAVAKEMVR